MNFVWGGDDRLALIPPCPFLDNDWFGASDINDNSVVLGSGHIQGAPAVATWSAAAGFIIVGSGDASAINNLGFVVGTSDGRAVLWQPVPEPSSFVVVSSGLECLGVFMKRRSS